MKHKLLLKDLPFRSKGAIISRVGITFYTDNGEQFYEGGGSSHQGRCEYGGIEGELLKALWDNPEWLGQYDSSHWWSTNNSDEITLKFKTSMPTEILVRLTQKLSSGCADSISAVLSEGKNVCE